MRCRADFLARIAQLALRLRHLPHERRADRPARFTALPGDGDHLTAGIIIAPSLGYMDRAYLDARAHGWSREPIVEMLIPSTLDDTLAPPGQHVASLFCQHVAPELPDGTLVGRPSRRGRRSDDRDGRQLRAGLCGERARPPDAVARSISSAQFGLLGGDIFHGALTLDQLFSARPDAGPCRLSRAAEGPLPLRLRRPSRRRRHRRARPQRGAGDPEGSPRPVRKPWIGLWMGCGQAC